MIIEKLKITGFRNIKALEVLFATTGNLIYGSNGAGKTSIMEAIFLMAFGKSFLNRKKSELINYQSDQFAIQLTAKNDRCSNHISCHQKEKYSLLLNDKKSNIFEVNQYLFPVFFSSSDYNLYIENSPYTRKMMDRFIFGVNTLYIRHLLGYNRALKQKNFLLKTTRNKSELKSWNIIISESAAKLIGIKMWFIDALNLEIKHKFNNALEIEYRPSLNVQEGISADAFYKQFETLTNKEVTYHRSLLGPHLDRFDLLLKKKPLGFYSSGEKKIHLLMIYISFIELFRKIKSEYPVFLVDDFDTAIDAKNISFLIDHYPEMQVIATSVNKNEHFAQLIHLEKEN